jgi:hypothetical protein
MTGATTISASVRSSGLGFEPVIKNKKGRAMRIVMPLFEFINGSEQEFEFGDGAYSLRRFDPNTDLPKDGIPGLSEKDRQYIKRELWALVAENPDLNTYTQDINRLLLSFKIHTLGRLFIKYRLCVDDASLCGNVRLAVEIE